jgi:predicted nucleic acid-binding Zn ribbon protein
MNSATPAPHCPFCKGTAVRRSRRRAGVIERLYNRAGRWPYRCQDCQKRFFLAAKETPAPAPSERRVERIRSEAQRRRRLILLFIGSLALFLLFLWKFILPPPAQNPSGGITRTQDTVATV